jgi:hypothetical protein
MLAPEIVCRFQFPDGDFLNTEVKPQEPAVAHKAFKSYKPGYVHGREVPPRCRMRAAGATCSWLWLSTEPRAGGRAAQGRQDSGQCQSLCQALHKACPIRISKLLTDNGKEFRDRLFASRERQPSGNHEFYQLCQELGVEHLLTKPRTVNTNGVDDRFNGRIAMSGRPTVQQPRGHGADLAALCALYNHQLPQSALKSNTPMQAMKEWYQTPHPFHKRP